MYTKEESRIKIKELTESFEAKIDFIKTSKEYKEAQIEDEFIKPLFKYLNWNISNEGIVNPHEREFIVQAQGRNRKEPDYLLQLENKRRFYIEAKHTKYDLQKRTDYIWQAYSYSYSTQTRPKYEKVDFALLTDFEEFRFFDCTFPAKNHETLNNYCVLDWTFKDYIKNFDKLWEYFERENVRNGSLEKLYISEKKIKENRISPDKAFLKDLDDEKNGWRIKLAKDVKKYHPDFSAEFITQTVQLILDRFIFIKVLVDREIEEDYIETIVNKIKGIKNKDEGIIYEECKEIFEQLDKTYNGSIFTKRTELDVVRVSNKILLDVLKDFLPQNSRYNFKVIPIEILGTIYEQFLGKVVVTTAKQAKIDYKPEVRKAGGVYYTPDYIVNYIVEKTIGNKLHDCKKFSDLLDIKICDPACGSGSFLISAYNALIQWTIEYYEGKIKIENGTSKLEKLSKEEQTLVYLDGEGNVRLTSKIKRDILKSCIYGVDIDPQAVEVTKMSLSLKALENTNHYEVYNERTLFHTTILPPLEGNIKCGNSLIGANFYSEQDISLFEEKEIRRINTFDWDREFVDIFNKNKSEDSQGFNIVIGNPPYRMYQPNNTSDLELNYYKQHFSITTYKIDAFHLFIQRSIQINRNNGYFGYIIPSTLLNNVNIEELRKWILDNSSIRYLNICNEKVFPDADVHSLIIITQKQTTNLKNLINATTVMNKSSIKNLQYSKVDQNIFLNTNGFCFNLLLNEKNISLINKLKTNSKSLGEISQINRGIVTGSKEKYYSDTKKSDKYKEILTGGDINRYYIKPPSKFIFFQKPKGAGGCWDEDVHFAPHKIVIRQIGDRPLASLLEKPFAVNVNIFTIMNGDKDLELFILGILNSKLIRYFWKIMFSDFKTSFPQITINSLKQIPIILEGKNFDEIRNSLLSKTRSTLSLKEKLISSKTEIEKTSIQRQFDFIDSEIDSLVYKLYDLTPDEITIVEEEF